MPHWVGLTQAQASRPAHQPASPPHACVCGRGSLALGASGSLGVTGLALSRLQMGRLRPNWNR